MKDAVIGAVSAALLVGGGWFAWSGQHAQSAPEPAPVPSVDISVGPDQPATGPTAAAPVDPNDPGAAAGPAVHPESMSASRLLIPAIGAYAPVEDHGLGRDGTLVLNDNPAVMTRYSAAAGVDDAEGTVLVAGHVSTYSRRGALYRLASLKAGERAYLTDQHGHRGEFVLTELRSYRKAALPDDVWAADGVHRLVVVTCGGDIVRGADGAHFRDNVVAVFTPVTPSGG